MPEQVNMVRKWHGRVKQNSQLHVHSERLTSKPSNGTDQSQSNLQLFVLSLVDEIQSSFIMQKFIAIHQRLNISENSSYKLRGHP